MQYKFYILAFSLLVYMLELVAIPAYCRFPEKVQTGCAAKTKDSSCNRASACSSKKMPTSKNSNSNENCLSNCPLCYATIVGDVIVAGKSLNETVQEYPVYQSAYNFIYSSSTWKPPNAS